MRWLLLFLVACNTEPPPRLALKPTDQETRAASMIPLLSPDAGKGAQPIGPVEGAVCKVGLHDPDPTKDEALAQLRVAAVRMGANAVVGTECDDEGMSLSKNCFRSITCRGTAAHLVTELQ